MFDLNATMFYKTKFCIETVGPEEDLLWKLILHIKSWQTRKWNSNGTTLLPTQNKRWTALKLGGRIFSNPHHDYTVFLESEYYTNQENGEEYWACRITEKRPPSPGCSRRDWVTEIGFERKNPSFAVFSCVLSYSDIPGFIGPCEATPVPTLPKIIRSLLNDKTIRCFYGPDTLSDHALQLSPGEWPEFWNRLTDKKRELPYIYISPQQIESENTECKLLIDPQALAKIVCGNALVFYADSLDFSNEMVYLSKKEYTCTHGRIRIYFSGLDPEHENDFLRHRYLTSAFIEEQGADYVNLIFRKALAQNVNFYDTFFRIDDCRKKKTDEKRRQQLTALQRQHEQELSVLKDAQNNQELELMQEYFTLQEQYEQLEKQNRALKSDIYNLESLTTTLHEEAAKSKELEKISNARYLLDSMDESTESVMTYFGQMFSDRIAFTDDAYRSAKDCRLSFADLWKVFFHLAMTMRDFYVEGTAMPEKEFYKTTGISCSRGEGSMTRKDKTLMTQFTTSYHGKSVNIEPHITYAKQEQSIHFGYFEPEQKIIVGSCGAHKKSIPAGKRNSTPPQTAFDCDWSTDVPYRLFR